MVGLGPPPKSMRHHEQTILRLATRRAEAEHHAGTLDDNSMDDGKVKGDTNNEDIDKEGVDDAAQEAHAPRMLRDPGQPSAREQDIHAAYIFHSAL